MAGELLSAAGVMGRKLAPLLGSVSPYVLPYLIGFLTAVLAEPLRQRLFRPRLKVEFRDDTNCISWTKEGETRACYLRIRVRNRKWRLARGCRAYLVNVELRDANGRFQPTSLPVIATACRSLGLLRPKKLILRSISQEDCRGLWM